MNTHTFIAVVISSAAASAVMAQTPQDGEIALRFETGRTSVELIRVQGDLQVIAGTRSAPLEIDVAAMQTWEILEVQPEGDAVAEIRPDATTARITMPGQRIFSQQDRESVTTLVNDVEQEQHGAPPATARLRIRRNGQTTAETGGANDTAGQLLATVTNLSRLLPGRRATTGERWKSSARVVLPAFDQGGSTFTLPALSLNADCELRSLEPEGGRTVATIVTTAEGNADDGSAPQKASITTRFDVTAGEFIDSEGTVSIDQRLPDLDPQASGGNAVRLTGTLRFHAAVLTPDTKAAPKVETQTQARTPNSSTMPSTSGTTSTMGAGRGTPDPITRSIRLQGAGVDLTRKDGRIFIGTLAAGTALAKSGLRQGDEIGGINGKGVDKMTEAEIKAAFQAGEVQLVIWRNDGKDMFGGSFRLK
ncbi:MAG: PDZ domain-containing protein [Verrucomicrobiaceae bacterium]|nr:PDZ domain-containing protein [Verrucomicrobiaceae bacterium]